MLEICLPVGDLDIDLVQPAAVVFIVIFVVVGLCLVLGVALGLFAGAGVAWEGLEFRHWLLNGKGHPADLLDGGKGAVPGIINDADVVMFAPVGIGANAEPSNGHRAGSAPGDFLGRRQWVDLDGGANIGGANIGDGRQPQKGGGE